MKIVCHGFDALRLLTTGAVTETQRKEFHAKPQRREGGGNND